MNRHDDSQRSGRLVTQPVRPTPCTSSPRANSLYEKQLTAPADRPVRTPAHADRLHHRGNSRWRRLGPVAKPACGLPAALPGDRNHAGSPPATDCRQNPPPAPPVNHIRCCADHRPAWLTRCRCRHPPSGQVLRACATSQLRSSSAYVLGLPGTACGAIPHRRSWNLPVPALFPYCSGSVTAQGAETPRDVAVLGVAFRLPPRGSIPGPHIPLSTLRPALTGGGVSLFTTPCRFFTGAQEVQNDTQRTARARGVSPG